MNRLTLLGIILLFSAGVEAVIAFMFVPEEVRIYIYGSIGLTTLLAIGLLLKGLATPSH
ncbi:MAG TPA: hypothetical protein PLF84_04925 [Bryobacteraceae bacterium]|nr:hypothetical protein [Bryobacteraceae bacterium]